MKNTNSILLATLVAAATLGMTGCDVKKTQEGSVTVPKYEVNKTQEGNVTLPKYTVTAPEVKVTTKEAEVTVPKVTTEEKTIKVPTIEVKTGQQKAAEKDVAAKK